MAYYTIQMRKLDHDERSLDVQAGTVRVLRDDEAVGSYAAALDAPRFAELVALVGSEDAARSALVWIAVHHAADLALAGWPSPGEDVHEPLTMDADAIAGFASPLPAGDNPVLHEFDA